ncbi:glycosyltransferase family 9 protein [uncultured Pseudodesulfovibrio sp.]|uniref:glycosyltransferase family 9 protein n=1 Tax=uncultured Pseudodesulfovibrio sp. TaxID=2035858 RepID=UPI0029C82E1F|nr:glycosyltransferase family 9 protein [uncultured Pseudodesulfovibrio sp.]
MNVLIINLTRFGDIIQTQPVISGFKSQGHLVGVVCLENFVSATTLLDGVDRVFPFPGAGLLAGVDNDWRLAVRDAVAFKRNILETFQPDRIVNLTPSVSSRLLTYDLTRDGGKAVGFTVDEFGFNADTTSWAAFLQMAGANRGASPFNICDVFRRTAGLDREGNSLELAAPDEDALTIAEKLLCEASEGGKGFVALQMGASENRRRWPVAYFIQTAQMLWEQDGLIPVLLGTKDEIGLGDRFVEQVQFPLVNCIGRTSLAELAGVLSRCVMLLTNDTGTMHLAAGLGVPLCAVFLATAQPWDTGPYRAGNICLEPDIDCHPCEFGVDCPHDETCRKAVTPEAMYDYAKFLLSGCETHGVSGVRAWRTRIGCDGFMELESLSGHDVSDRAAWIALQRFYFLSFLDGINLTGKTGLAENIHCEMHEDISKTLTSAVDMLFLLSQQGMLLQKNPRPAAKTKFMTSWQRLQNILSSCQHLNIIALLWMFETQQNGNDLSSLLDLAERYRALLTSLRDEFV